MLEAWKTLRLGWDEKRILEEYAPLGMTAAHIAKAREVLGAGTAPPAAATPKPARRRPARYDGPEY
jgi:hypothetical protein